MVFYAFSVPSVIVSDNAKCFVSKEYKQFCFGLGIKLVTTTPCYRSPAHAELFNRKLLSALISFQSNLQSSYVDSLT
jgi:transposase InsO family protein